MIVKLILPGIDISLLTIISIQRLIKKFNYLYSFNTYETLSRSHLGGTFYNTHPGSNSPELDGDGSGFSIVACYQEDFRGEAIKIFDDNFIDFFKSWHIKNSG
jgi:hypothetical protein